MSRRQLARIIDRICNSDRVTLLCAPPGFRKRDVLLELAESWPEKGDVRFLDSIDHRENPRLAGNEVLSAGAQTLLLIADPFLCDGQFLVQTLERRARTDSPVKVVIALDALDQLPIAGMRASGALDIVDSNILALSSEESRAALKSVGLKAVRQRITRVAGNWPAALNLLVRIAQTKDSSTFELSDSDLLRACGLNDFIEQRVLPLLTEGERDVLARASMLSNPSSKVLRLTAQEDRHLASAVHKLQGLVDRMNGNLSINHALRIFFLEHSAAVNFETFQSQMLELADRCASNGRLNDAARLAAEAGSPERIGLYAQEHGALLIWVLCGFSDVRALVENAGAAVVEGSPVLRMMSCIVDLKIGNIHRAEAEFRRLADDPEIAGSMGKEIEIIRVTLLAYGCSLARLNDLELLADLLAEQSTEPAWQTFLATLSCLLNSQRGRLQIAYENLREARLHADRAGSRYNLMFLHLHEAGIALAQGKLGAARSQITDARKMWRTEFSDDVGAETVLSALTASIEFELGRLTSTRNALRKSAYRMPEAEAWFDIYFAAYEPYARLYLKDHDLPSTLDMLASEGAKVEARGLERVARLLRGLADCLAGEAQRRGDKVEHSFNVASEEESPVWSWQEREIFTLASAHAHASAGDIERAIEKLTAARVAAIDQSLNRTVLRYEIQLFLLYAEIGDTKSAVRSLREIIAIGAASGAHQIVSDLAGFRLDEYAADLGGIRPLSGQEVQFLARAGLKKASPRGGPAAALSLREIEVLGALSSGGSDKELARQLGLSDHGVRYHLKSIFRKLEVHDRTSAVAAARQRSLL